MNRLPILAGLAVVAAVIFGHNIVDVAVNRTPALIPVALAWVAVIYVRRFLRMVGQ